MQLTIVVAHSVRRIALPQYITTRFNFRFQCTESAQEVVSVGVGTISLGMIRIQQVACAEKVALLLTHDGAIYTLPYDTMSPHLVPGMYKKIPQDTQS